MFGKNSIYFFLNQLFRLIFQQNIYNLIFWWTLRIFIYYSGHSELPKQNVRRRSGTFGDGRPSERTFGRRSEHSETFGRRSETFGIVRDRSETFGIVRNRSESFGIVRKTFVNIRNRYKYVRKRTETFGIVWRYVLKKNRFLIFISRGFSKFLYFLKKNTKNHPLPPGIGSKINLQQPRVYINKF